VGRHERQPALPLICDAERAPKALLLCINDHHGALYWAFDICREFKNRAYKVLTGISC